MITFRTMRLTTVLAVASMVGVVFLSAALASHSQSTPAGIVRFAQVGGSEWWVQLRVEGPAASSVMAKDTGGAWVSLQSQTWTFDGKWWAGSFHVEPGHQVMFTASFPGATGIESCWFDHPSGIERCDATPPPTFDATFSGVRGNEWWVQAGVSAPGATISEVAVNTGSGWNLLTLQSWGAWAASYHVAQGTTLQIRATSSTGATDFSDCYRWIPAQDQDASVVACDSNPLPGTFDATFSGVRGNEWWIQASVSTAGGTLSSVDAHIEGQWRPITKQSWGAWAASYHFTPGVSVQLRATSTTGAADLSDCYRWIPATDQDAATITCGTIPPPPTGSQKEAETFAIRTTGGLQQGSGPSGGAAWNLWSNGHIQDTMHSDGSGFLIVVARGSPFAGTFPTMVVSIDGTVAQTFTVNSPNFAEYRTVSPSAGSHTIRIAFTNDASSSTEDRNLILDVVRIGAGTQTGAGPWTLQSGQSATWTIQWAGGPGYIVADAATDTSVNLRPSLSIAIDGNTIRHEPVAGPVARPALAAFNLPQGQHVVTFTAHTATVKVSDATLLTSAPPTTFSGAAARAHVGGSQEGSGWRFTDFGYMDSRLIVDETGWYLLRVQGVGTINDVGPLVHLLLNRTVVAESVQGTTIDVSRRYFLVDGVGYTLGASFENPWPDRTARFDVFSATPSSAPAPLAAAVHVDALNNPAGWPQYGRDGYNTRTNDDPNLPTTETAGSVELKWRVTVDGSVTSTPAVVDGRVYFGTWAKSMYAVNEETGAVIWRTTMPTVVDGSPAVAQGKVIVGVGTAIMALDATTGLVLWTTTFGGRQWASPTIDGNDVFVGVGSGQGHVARLNLHTGAIIWTITTAPTNQGARVWASPLVPPGSGLVVVGTSPGSGGFNPPTIDSLIALDRDDGAFVWVHQLFPRDQNLERTHDETLLTNRDISGTPHLTFLDGRPVVLASQKHGPAWILDLTTGALVSGSRLIDQRAALIGSGGVSEGVRVVSASDPDRIAGFSVETGDLLWQQSMPSTEFSPVAIANGVVWVGSWGGFFHAYDLHTGRELARVDAGGGILGGASLANGAVFVGGLQNPSGGGPFQSLGSTPGTMSAWEVP